jgi:hypothetical protein
VACAIRTARHGGQRRARRQRSTADQDAPADQRHGHENGCRTQAASNSSAALVQPHPSLTAEDRPHEGHHAQRPGVESRRHRFLPAWSENRLMSATGASWENTVSARRVLHCPPGNFRLSAMRPGRPRRQWPGPAAVPGAARQDARVGIRGAVATAVRDPSARRGRSAATKAARSSSKTPLPAPATMRRPGSQP